MSYLFPSYKLDDPDDDPDDEDDDPDADDDDEDDEDEDDPEDEGETWQVLTGDVNPAKHQLRVDFQGRPARLARISPLS